MSCECRECFLRFRALSVRLVESRSQFEGVVLNTFCCHLRCPKPETLNFLRDTGSRSKAWCRGCDLDCKPAKAITTKHQNPYKSSKESPRVLLRGGAAKGRRRRPSVRQAVSRIQGFKVEGFRGLWFRVWGFSGFRLFCLRVYGSEFQDSGFMVQGALSRGCSLGSWLGLGNRD